MLLISLSLENIRSYHEATIEFPEGSTLLSGDVGSGKTTILLAIEFALFGIQRGELAASSLLRHGERQGSVTLNAAINNKDVTITRTLKRDKDGIKQGAGKLLIDGKEESLTHVELKARILDLLGYPHELLTKAKSLLFRYTVYTPQEEMKRILFDDPDARLETLRKLFGIDQYRRARDNAATTSKELRIEERALRLQLEELPHLKKEHKEAAAEAKRLAEAATQAAKDAKAAEESRAAAEAQIKALLDEQERLQAAEHATKSLRRTIRDLDARKDHLAKTVEQANKNKQALRQEQAAPPADTKEQTRKKEAARTKVEERLRQARQQYAKAEAIKEEAQRNQEELAALSASCPLCRQAVPHEHKERLIKEQAAKEGEQAEKLATIAAFIKEAESKLATLERAIKDLRDQQLARAQALERAAGIKRQARLLDEQAKHAQEELEAVMKGRERAAQELAAQEESLARLAPARKRYEEQQARTAAAQLAAREAAATQARAAAESEAAQEREERLEKEVARLEKHQSRASLLHSTLHWLKEGFIPATARIEQAVFSALHGEFAQLFSAWFATIIEDEALQVGLDRSFTPVITLNGYDTEAESLSGGEKTAVALAYRLALNQVINEYITTIQTKDLLILDEPTDGFSAHQLDRMRDVLDQLRLRQLILVSHEAKMEGFVEHVIRISKQEQTSTIS
ncbi:hypothetical protein JXA12_04045 [Candidatus Woesearchaeota archaeon]|nr:hypothetical protein [Candidatus Woesearchaeota archaeon]